MIHFQRIRYQNLLSTGNLFTEIDLAVNKTTLVVGANGSGKSTILDALAFVLFNKPFRKINKPQLMNSITNRELLVEIEFKIGRKQYLVRRGVKPNLFEIYINGVLQNQEAASRDYQVVLEDEILKMNFKTFCQVVVLGSASYVPFMQLPGGNRREIIEDLLNLEVFTKMNSIVKEKITGNLQEITDIDANKRVTQTKIDLMKAHLAENDESRQKALETKQEALDSVLGKLVDSDFVLVKAVTIREELLGSIAPLKGMKKKVAESERYEVAIKVKMDGIRNSKSLFEQNDFCHTCNQPITDDHRTHSLEDADNKLKELQLELDVATKTTKEMTKLVTEMEKKDQKLQEVNNKIKELEYRRETWQEQVQTLQDELIKMKNVRNNVDIHKISALEQELSDLEHKYTSLFEEKNIYAAASMVLKDGGIKSKIIKQYVPIINKFINKYLSAMDFFVNFELNEQFEETIKSRHRDDFSYWSFSEGEKMRINLAVLFTWRAVAKQRSSISTNLLIMDEVFDSSLDTDGTEEFMKILNNLTNDTNTFIISHRQGQLYDRFEKVISFEKIANFSKIKA